MSEFLKNIIDPKNDVGKIFESLNNNVLDIDWKSLQTEFHDAIEGFYPSIRCETNSEVAEEKNPIPQRLKKRIKVTTLLLGILALGGKYSRELYFDTLSFCTSTDIGNGKLASKLAH